MVLSSWANIEFCDTAVTRNFYSMLINYDFYPQLTALSQVWSFLQKLELFSGFFYQKLVDFGLFLFYALTEYRYYLICQVNFCKQNLECLLKEFSKKCNEKLP